jgi:hypothetical protein
LKAKKTGSFAPVGPEKREFLHFLVGLVTASLERFKTDLDAGEVTPEMCQNYGDMLRNAATMIEPSAVLDAVEVPARLWGDSSSGAEQI